MAVVFGQQLGGVPRKGWPQSLKKFFNYCDNRNLVDGTSLNGVAAAVTGMVVSEGGFGPYRKTTFTFTNCSVPLTYSAGVVSYKGTKIYDFPKGVIKILGAVAKIVTTKDSAGLTATWAGLFSMGTVTAAADATLTSTEANVVPSTVLSAAVAGVGAIAAANAADIVPYDGSGTAMPLFANILANTADTTATAVNVILNGTITVHWLNLGAKS